MDCECSTWARESSSKLTTHHPECRLHKKVFYKLSPELGDGMNHQIVDSQGMLDAISAWSTESKSGWYVGESFTVECVSMTQEEFDALPEL